MAGVRRKPKVIAGSKENGLAVLHHDSFFSVVRNGAMSQPVEVLGVFSSENRAKEYLAETIARRVHPNAVKARDN